jgi:hypothetical protein
MLKNKRTPYIRQKQGDSIDLCRFILMKFAHFTCIRVTFSQKRFPMQKVNTIARFSARDTVKRDRQKECMVKDLTMPAYWMMPAVFRDKVGTAWTNESLSNLLKTFSWFEIVQLEIWIEIISHLSQLPKISCCKAWCLLFHFFKTWRFLNRDDTTEKLNDSTRRFRLQEIRN